MPTLAASAAGLATQLPAVLMIAIFLVMTGLMYMRKISALLALPIMAVAFALVGMVRVLDFFTILVDVLAPDSAALLRWSGAAWIAILAAVVWARRRRFLSALMSWSIPIIALVIAFTINHVALAVITERGVWSELFACFETKAILDQVIHKGAIKLHEAYTIAFFGGMLAIYVKEKRLAETLIKYAAELGGDKPLVVAIIMMLATMALFTTLGGLGAIIMVGTIIMPIMLSLGLSPYVVAGVFLIGVCAGGTFNPAGWALYKTSLGLDVGAIQKFALIMVMLYLLTGVLFVVLSTRGKWRRRRWTWAAPAGESDSMIRVRPIALLTPVVPIVLVLKLSTFAGLFLYLQNVRLFLAFATLFFVLIAAIGWYLFLSPKMRRSPGGMGSPVWLAVGLIGLGALVFLYAGPRGVEAIHAALMSVLARFTVFAQFWDSYIGGWEFVPAFLAGVLFCLVTTWDPKGNNVQMLTKSVIEGAESVMPAVLLMCGIGMLLQVVLNPQISSYLQPLIAAVTPTGKVLYVIGFGLAAPLALYRGPLNVWGLGLGIAAVMLQTDRLSASLLMGMFMSVGAVQGVCDPTNTHNVWIANFLGEDVLAITRFLLPYIWVMVFVGLIVAALVF